MRRLALATLFIAAIAMPSIAQPRPPFGNGGPPPGAPGAPPPPNPAALAAYVNLTSDEKAQWDAARQAFETAAASLHDKIESTHTQLQQLMDANSTDAAAIGSLMIAIRDTQSQLKAQHDALDSKLESVLTPEQKTKFEAFRAAAAFLAANRPHPPGGGGS